MSLDRGGLVDHWNWPVSPGHQSCDRWSRRLWPSMALGHVAGLGGHPVQRFANATAMMVMNKNYKGRGYAPKHRCLDYGFLPPSTEEVRPKVALAIHVGHDANIAMSIDGRVQCVLELERFFGERYYHLLGYGSYDWSDVLRLAPRYRTDFLEAMEAFWKGCECEGGRPCPRRGTVGCDGKGGFQLTNPPATPNESAYHHFDFGVIIEPHLMFDIPGLAEEVMQVKQWRWVHHHEAHALLGFLSSPFHRALVVSYDGGGDDGTYNAFYGRGQTVQRVARLDVNFAGAYNSMTNVFTEIYPECEEILSWYCQNMDSADTDWTSIDVVRSSANMLSDAGKIMGYSAVAADLPVPAAVQRSVAKLLDLELGRATLDPAKQNRSRQKGGVLPTEMVALACQGKDKQDLLAAELQRQWQQRSLDLIKSLLERLEPVDGVVLMGGFFVPPAPSDCGISVGGLFAVSPPTQRQEMQYLGFKLWDRDELHHYATQRGARRLSELGGIPFLARLLATPRADGQKPIVALVRGRQEFGPRALGHRSLVAVPDVEEMKRRMNRLKFRKWYRPIAPMIAEEALESVFGRKVLSRYMERAPKVLDWVRRDFPAMVHFDGTARHQSVGVTDEPWLHQLLLAVSKHTKLAALINTSFNTRGKPIVNSIKESLVMLDTLPDLDYVLIEDYLFVGPEGKALPAEEFREKKGAIKMMGYDGSQHDMPGQGANGSSKKGMEVTLGKVIPEVLPAVLPETPELSFKGISIDLPSLLLGLLIGLAIGPLLDFCFLLRQSWRAFVRGKLAQLSKQQRAPLYRLA
eukprot:s44_g18.t1